MYSRSHDCQTAQIDLEWIYWQFERLGTWPSSRVTGGHHSTAAELERHIVFWCLDNELKTTMTILMILKVNKLKLPVIS